ncbi:MATE family efflux transporter [Niameybacter massiliensis]|uniref:MATE family efflux transporter n=1 Tax=Holtiella tumoricola TaxID=3018743 RepID=A0AA42J4T2_9FIRM|nr:MATE family efflux transporter [Holtiella tumoricola]MDA3734206.1 MATE family efflux transporter [Holtiella tumoricola]
MKENIKNMTVGSPMKLIASFFMPLLLGMLFQQFYSMVDTMIVGRFLGAKALAAVGGTGSINFMIIGFCMGVCNGFAIPVAQAFGAGDESSVRKYVANSAWLSVVFSLVTTVIVCVLCRKILGWMDTPSDIFEGAYDYIFVIFLGIPVIYLYNLLAGILRSLGDSKTPLYFLVISSLLNIILDLVAILVLDMGVAGAAWATVISQGISGILCLIYIYKKFTILKINKEEWQPKWGYMRGLCMMGIPMGLQYSITAIGSVILQTAVNSLGSMAVAAITAGNKINMLFCCPFDAMGATMATYSGQNVGAGKFDRVTDGLKACSLIALLYSIVSCVVLFIFGEQLSLMFVDGSEVDIIRDAALLLKCTSTFFFPLALVNIVRFTIQGMGFGNLAILAGVCEMIARSVVGFVFVPMFGYTAACFASPVAWIMADLFLIPAYIYVINKLKRRNLEQDYMNVSLSQ